MLAQGKDFSVYFDRGEIQKSISLMTQSQRSSAKQENMSTFMLGHYEARFAYTTSILRKTDFKKNER